MLGDKVVGVVVLNYKNYIETIDCVCSLLKQENVEIKIVIVDNGSGNESVEYITKAFSNEKNVQIVTNKMNLGYAKGNNIGIKLLLNERIRFILVSNSDVNFSTPYILKDMVDAYCENVGVMIPIIKNLDGTIEMRAQYKQKLFPLRATKELVKMQLWRLQGGKKSIKSNENAYCLLPPGVQKTYHLITGSVFALTPDFFDYYSGLFPETFLYVEELATLLLIDKAKLECQIVDTAPVIHKGAASTEASLHNGTVEKRKMVACSARNVMKLVIMPRRLISRKYR